MAEDKAKFDKIAYNNEFNKGAYDRINLTVPKGEKDKIKTHAGRLDGGSVNAFIYRAIVEQMKRDNESL